MISIPVLIANVGKSYWIRSQISSCLRIVVTMKVIVIAGLNVIILSWETEIIFDGTDTKCCLAKGIVGSGPDGCTSRVSQLLRSPIVIILVVVIIGADLLEEGVGSPCGIGGIAVGFDL